MTRRRIQSSNSTMIGELFTFLLFAMFLVLSLLIVVIGADGYRNVVHSSDNVSEVRTSLGYVSGKVRSDAAIDSVRIDQVEGTDVLVLTEIYEGDTYETAIYHMNGALYEMYYNASEIDLQLGFGDRLTKVTGFDMAWADDNLLALTATADDGTVQTLHIALRKGQGVQN